MRKMKQLLAAGLMMSMIAATSAGTSVFASTPEVVETNESTKTESSKVLLCQDLVQVKMRVSSS